MSLAGKQTPLSLNVLSSLMQSIGFKQGQYSSDYAGSYTPPTTYNYGSIVGATCLLNLMLSAIYAQGKIGSGITQGTYDNLISIGAGSIRALGNTPPTTYTTSISTTHNKFGFIAQLAIQAYNELHPNDGTYADFVNSYMVCHNYVNSNNDVISSMVNSADFLKGAYSNMDDLVTGDVTGVSLSTIYWGQDLINLGRALDLKKIATFGNPADLLLTLQANNAFTKAVSLALLATGLTSPEILSILTATTPATIEQQKKIYTAYKIIMGTDLENVLIPLNCQTKGLNTLADLLNPIKIFPNSYSTLTVPKYNSVDLPTNSKTYYLIYEGTGVNSQLLTYGTRLNNVIPGDIAAACDAFSTTMQQIKNVASMDVQKLAQVVSNMETMKDLDLNNTDVPTNQTLVAPALAQIANGSGESGTYTMYDFFGALVGNAYKLDEIQTYILKLQSSNLTTIYANINSLLLTAGPYTALQGLIDDANTEVAAIMTSNPTDAAYLNTLWNDLGTQLQKEIDLRSDTISVDTVGALADIYSFVDMINQYATETQAEMSVDVLEKISDITTVGGRSIIGLMREIRNAQRIMLAGGILDNDIDNKLSITFVNNLGIPKVTGVAIPGSLAGSPETNLIPENLDVYTYAPTTVIPSIYTPSEAIDDVIRCNCDCWDNL
jgi:hypothetical protein